MRLDTGPGFLSKYVFHHRILPEKSWDSEFRVSGNREIILYPDNKRVENLRSPNEAHFNYVSILKVLNVTKS